MRDGCPQAKCGLRQRLVGEARDMPPQGLRMQRNGALIAAASYKGISNEQYFSSISVKQYVLFFILPLVSYICTICFACVCHAQARDDGAVIEQRCPFPTRRERGRLCMRQAY